MWLPLVAPAFEAAAGAAYPGAAVGHLGRPVPIGALVGGWLAPLNYLRIRRQRAATAPPAA